MTTSEQPLPTPAQLADDLAEAMRILWDVIALL